MNLINPLYLLISIPSVAFLIYAYLNKGEGKKVYVGSLYLLKKLSHKSSLKNKLNFPLRFFSDLFLLLFLIFIFAGLSLNQSKKLINILVDNSLSTAASFDQQTVLEKNIAELVVELKREGSDDSYLLCWTSPTFECQQSELKSLNALQSALSKIKPIKAVENLNSAVKQLRSADYNMIVTDKRPKEFLSDYRIINARPESLNNIAISGVFTKGAHNEVTIRNFASTPVDDFLFLEFLSFNQEDNSWKRAGRRKINFSIIPGGKSTFDFSFSGEDHEFALISLNPELKNGVNALLQDDSYWIVNQGLSSNQSVKFYLVTNDTKRNWGLEQLLNSKFSVMDSSQYQQALENGIFSDESKLIFINYLPEQLPEFDSLFLSANAANGFLKLNYHQSSELSSWKSDSDLLKYLKPADLKFTKTWTAELPAWFDRIITVNGESLLASGKRLSNQYVFVGFPLLPFSGKDNPELSTLAFNIFNFFTKSSLSAKQSASFQTHWQLVSEQGKLNLVKGEESSFNVLDLSENKSDGQINNFYAEEESDLRKIKFFNLSKENHETSRASQQVRNSTLVKSYLAMFLLALVIWTLLGNPAKGAKE